jgi:hypothetical protein
MVNRKPAPGFARKIFFRAWISAGFLLDVSERVEMSPDCHWKAQCPYCQSLGHGSLQFGGRVDKLEPERCELSGAVTHFIVCTKSCTRTKLSLLEIVLSGMLPLNEARVGQADAALRYV